MKENILDSLEHCPVCGRYYTDDDAMCDCEEQKVKDWEDINGHESARTGTN